MLRYDSPDVRVTDCWLIVGDERFPVRSIGNPRVARRPSGSAINLGLVRIGRGRPVHLLIGDLDGVPRLLYHTTDGSEFGKVTRALIRARERQQARR